MHSSSPICATRLLALLLAAAGPVACRQAATPAQNSADGPVTNRPAIVRASPPLDRAGLLAFVAQAASAAAAGTPVADQLRGLDGRQFEVRIRFGCRGPTSQNSSEWLAWSYDAESRAIRISARPTISADDPLVTTVGGEDIEAAEGFWIPRPWLLQPVCPAGAAVRATPEDPEEPTPLQQEAEPLPIRQRVGIAQFFTASDARTGRRDNRPYQAVHTLGEGQAIGSQGFNLVLSGRLRDIPGRGVIGCVASGADTPPDCIVSAEFQRAWIERPENGEVIAEWGGG